MSHRQSSENTTNGRTLRQLEAGETGTIRSVHVSTEDYTRLAGLGLCPGRKIEVLQTGERMIVRSGPTCVGLHAALAGGVRVSV